MKALTLAVLIIGLFASSQADVWSDLLGNLKDTALQAVDGLVQTGKQALSKTASDLLQSLTGVIGKRSLVADSLKDHLGSLVSGLGGLLDKAKKAGADLFKGAVDKLHQLTGKLQEKIGSVTDSKQTDAAIDAVVADHEHKQKRLISELIAHGKKLLSGAVDKVKDLASKAKAFASDVASGLLQKGATLIGRRGLTDHLKTIGSAISSAVSPFKDTISGLGDTLKGHFSNLVDTVKGHVNTLKGKLSGHIDDLKGHGQKLLDHGKNALGALGEVVSDILNQTLTNAKPHIEGAAKTLADAGNTVVGHVTG